MNLDDTDNIIMGSCLSPSYSSDSSSLTPEIFHSNHLKQRKTSFFTFDQEKKNDEQSVTVFINNTNTIITSFANDFKTIERISSSLFSRVYSVYSLTENKIYAVKTSLSTSNNLSFNSLMSEINILSQLGQNSHIIHVYKAWQESDGMLFMLMESCSRGTLSMFLNELKYTSEFLPEKSIWILISHLTNALKNIHSHGYIHNDIKPENILINENGSYILTDFGSCSKYHESSKDGDRRYISVDGIHEYAEYYHDIFSMGLVLYQIMLKIELPLDGEEWTNIRTGKFQELPTIYSHELKMLVKNMISANVTERPTIQYIYNYSHYIQLYNTVSDDIILATLPIQSYGKVLDCDAMTPHYSQSDMYSTPVYKQSK